LLIVIDHHFLTFRESFPYLLISITNHFPTCW